MRYAVAVLALWGASCSFAPGSRSGTLPPPPERPVRAPELPDVHPYGPPHARLAPGQWVEVRAGSGTDEVMLTVAVVAVEGPRAWIEVLEKGEPSQASLRLVDGDGRIERAFYREGPDGPVVEQPLVQAGAPVEPLRADSVENARGEERLGTRTVPVEIEIRIARDQEMGREERETRAWSPEVPPVLGASESGAGLVRLESRARRLQVLAFGDDHVPSIRPPPR